MVPADEFQIPNHRQYLSVVRYIMTTLRNFIGYFTLTMLLLSCNRLDDKAKQLGDKEAKEYTSENIFNTQNSTVPQESKWFNEITTKQFEWPQKK